jgi:MoxR-like ATPase
MLAVRHPTKEAERSVVQQSLLGFNPSDLNTASLNQVFTAADLVAMQGALSTVRVDPELIDYAVDIVTRTRAHRSVYLGASPRGSLGLIACARANAAMAGRAFVIPDDVKTFSIPVLRHRLVLHPDAELEGVGSDAVIESILTDAPVPKSVG